ncbi:hypothetical protein ACRALDRAFT_207838 [Sodiomyces alcalophilus JCM 7366]|uniref:uncharacterized protein n=1 Tax=Sodiomyces alcalophilus JCM 7366 TaxID=591952 RepID=UPI0039B6284C
MTDGLRCVGLAWDAFGRRFYFFTKLVDFSYLMGNADVVDDHGRPNSSGLQATLPHFFSY